ncbi:MAG TPA: nuclear transport factor 2 family protein [Gaiellaceae bacterium]
MDTESAARRWRDVWLRAWKEKDVDAVASLYTDGAAFRSQPFRPLQDPREYAQWAFSEQGSAECRFGEPLVEGDRAACEYWGVVSFQGRDETIAGVAVIRFDAAGLVTEQRDYWNAEEGRREPPPGWGR